MTTEPKPRILIVEDERQLNNIYSTILSKGGMEALQAFDGEEGLRKIYEEKPDLVILDLMLPKKHGFEILEDIKKNPDLKDIPVLIVSNLGQDQDIAKGKDLGAADYLIKSNFSIDDIVEKVKSTLSAERREYNA